VKKAVALNARIREQTNDLDSGRSAMQDLIEQEQVQSIDAFAGRKNAACSAATAGALVRFEGFAVQRKKEGSWNPGQRCPKVHANEAVAGEN